jgi:hypothetical protein
MWVLAGWLGQSTAKAYLTGNEEHSVRQDRYLVASDQISLPDDTTTVIAAVTVQ